MRKFSFVIVALLLVFAFAQVGYCAYNSWGNTDTNQLLGKVAPGYLQYTGSAFGGAGTVSCTSAGGAISTAYSVLSITTSSDVGSVYTLANGTPGQVLTLIVVSRSGSGTCVITPATKTGYTTVTTGAALSYVTLEYIDSSVGWIIIGSEGCTVA